MEIILYYAPTTCALAPFITLTEANAPFEVWPLNLRKDQHKSAEYLKINPKHKVPLLIVDGMRLSENVAIQQWIVRQFPQAKLLPSDPWSELQAISLLSWCASGIHPYLSRVNSPSRVCDVPDAGESVRRLAADQLFENYRIADDMLAGREFSSTISRRQMRISFGASAAARSSSWICRDTHTAPRIFSE